VRELQLIAARANGGQQFLSQLMKRGPFMQSGANQVARDDRSRLLAYRTLTCNM
jgi:hypothetical protein